jgi:hypothetical protein
MGAWKLDAGEDGCVDESLTHQSLPASTSDSGSRNVETRLNLGKEIGMQQETVPPAVLGRTYFTAAWALGRSAE